LYSSRRHSAATAPVAKTTTLSRLHAIVSILAIDVAPLHRTFVATCVTHIHHSKVRHRAGGFNPFPTVLADRLAWAVWSPAFTRYRAA